MKKVLNTKTLLSLCLLLAPICVFAGGGHNNHMDAPLDGGLSLLLAAGVGYGAKMYIDKKRVKSGK